MPDLRPMFADNFVIGLAHDIMRLRGKDPRTCTQDDLHSAYERAESMAESCVRIARRISLRAAKEAA